MMISKFLNIHFLKRVKIYEDFILIILCIEIGTTKAAINYYRALLRYQSDFSRAEISAPVLVLWGCQDRPFGEELIDASQKYCSDIRIKKIVNGSHWINQDAPDVVNKYMEIFLKETPAMEHTYDF